MKDKIYLSKKAIFIVLIFSIIFVPIVKGQEQKNTKKIIFTSGKATTWIKPDRVRIFLGIETISPVLGEARRANAEKINQVLNALKKIKIKDMLVKAPSLNISLIKESEYKTPPGRVPKILGYRVRQEFTVLLKNKNPKLLSKNAGLVVDTALENGANILSQIVFFKEDDSEERRKTLKLAVEDAIANAKVMAKAAGVSIKEYIHINSNLLYVPRRQQYIMHQMAVPEAAGPSTTLIAGELGLTCKVTIQCTIE